LADRSNLPHVLIDAIPELTARLIRSDQTTFVFSSNAVVHGYPTWSSIENRHRRALSPFDEDDELDEAAPTTLALVCQFDPIGLIFEALNAGEAPIEDAMTRLQGMVEGVNKHFKLEFDEPVRIACVGSHGSLWQHEHINVPQRNSEIRDYLDKAAKRRQFVADLHSALSKMRGVELQWLAESCAAVREDRERYWITELPQEYGRLAGLTRRHLREKPKLKPLRGCVPLIYSGLDGEWQLYGDGPKGPSRTTKRLLEQFSTSKARSEGHHAVLVKLLPDDPGAHNPCDNPIIDTEQLELAQNSGITAVLLDARCGVIHHSDVKAKHELPDIYAA
jgi:hypothetical protein